MNLDDLGLETLPLQRELIESVLFSFMYEENVVAGVLLGSLAAGTGDRVSDADVLIFIMTLIAAFRHSSREKRFSIV